MRVRFVNGSDASNLTPAALELIDESLTQFCSILIGRLLKSRALRRGLSQLRFDVAPVIFIALLAPNLKLPSLDSTQVVQSLAGFDNLLRQVAHEPVGDEIVAETRSVIEGAKALTRPQKRVIDDPATQQPAAALAALEAEIANFDQRQRRAALVTAPGPQRIRGLAGS